ncbi:DUF11 domain-containing protein [Chloroflexales bacterium ZM16-3]|nr:DUF11 domain-containing protein [Chloroflexales bacterium ZM16-3]
MLITEVPSSEPATRTPLPPPPPPPADTATSIPVDTATSIPVDTAVTTNTPVPTATTSSGGGGSSRKSTPVPTSTPTETPTPTETLTPVPQFADPAITKSANISNAQVGDTVEFTLTATNRGNIPASNVVIEDTLPSFLALEGVSATRGDVSVNGATIRVTIGDLAPGEVVTVTITARVVSSAAPPNNSNIATIASSDATDDPSNNSSAVSLNVDQPPPAILPNTGDPEGGASIPVLVVIGIGLIAASLITRRRRV